MMATLWRTLDLSPVGNGLRRLGLPGVPPGRVQAIAEVLAEDLRARAPQRSGRLAESIEGRADGEAATWGSPLPYASQRLVSGTSADVARRVAGLLHDLTREVFDGPAR